MTEITLSRFPLGHTVITPGALDILTELFGETLGRWKMTGFLQRHHCGDWGEMDEHDLQANEQAAAGWSAEAQSAFGKYRTSARAWDAGDEVAYAVLHEAEVASGIDGL